ncbi:hypothetical protein Tco_0013508 [Tanacetum coccineum]
MKELERGASVLTLESLARLLGKSRHLVRLMQRIIKKYRVGWSSEKAMVRTLTKESFKTFPNASLIDCGFLEKIVILFRKGRLALEDFQELLMLDSKRTLEVVLCILWWMVMMTSRHPDTVFRSEPIWRCDRLVSGANVIENQVMEAPVISISLDVSVESVGSSFPRVILIGSISVEVPIAPDVGAAAVASPAGVLELGTHSPSEADPSESSLPLVSVAPMVLPFLCSDDSESDTEISERHVSPTPHDVMLTRWRSRVASRSSSSTTSTSEIPTAPIPPAPSTVDIPIGRLYRTHFGGPCRALTARKSVRPLSSHRLSLRYISHHLDRFTSGSSSGHSSSDHSSFGHYISCYSLFGHTPPDTTIVDSSAPPRVVYPPLTRALRCSKAYRHWRSAPLSTMYLPTTSESSAGDSFSESSAGPSRKRCRSPAATITSSIHATRALVPSRVDLLPPRKRFRDSISLENSVEEDINANELADIEVDTTAVEVVVDRNVVVGVDAGIDMEVNIRVDVEDEVEDEVESSDRGTMEVGVDVVARIDIPNGMLMPNVVEHLEQVEEVVQDIYGHVMEIPLQRIEDIETGQKELEARSLISGGERASLLEQIRRFRYYDRMRFRILETFVARRLEHDYHLFCQSQNGSDGDNGNDRNRNGRNSENGNGNPNENDRGPRPVARECTYQDFMKCQPLNFKGTEGVVGFISALTWWNSHKRIIGTDAAFSIFQELTKLCTKMVPEEEDRVERFIGGLPDNIQGNVIVAEPTRLQDDVRIANNLMD